MVDSRFFAKLNETVSLDSGRSYYRDLVFEGLRYYYNQRRVMPSVYQEENLSANYSLHLRARGLELAKLRLFMESIAGDVSIDDVRSGFLYQNFGYLLQLKEPFFFPEKSDEFYRKYAKALLNVILKGSTRAAITEGISIFAEGLPFTVEQVYLDAIERKYALDRSGIIRNANGEVLSTLNSDPNILDKNIFNVRFDLDNRQQGTDVDFIIKGVEFFLDIMKPAHNAYRTVLDLSDTFDLRGGCSPEYTLVEGEEIAETIQQSPGSGLIVTAQTDNVLTLSDNTQLFVLDSTVITDNMAFPITYGDLNIGDEVEITSHTSEGRYQYAAPLSTVPVDLVFNSVGFDRAPLVEEVDSDFRSRPDFQQYVLKNLDVAGVPIAVKAEPTAICDSMKPSLYTWYYEDFRKCGALQEYFVSLEDVSSSYDPLNNSIHVSNPVISDGLGTGNAAPDTSYVTVFVNSVVASVDSVNAFSGEIVLTDLPPGGAVIKVTYYYSEFGSYVMEMNTPGKVMNKTFSTGSSGVFALTMNEGDPSNGVRKVNYKTTAFLLSGSSLLNLSYSLMDNAELPLFNFLNRARVTRNHTEKACQVNDVSEQLGLNTEGECLNYPTPPVPLRFDANAPIPDPWKIIEADELNSPDDKLNDYMRLNSVVRRAVYGPYDKRYSFANIEKAECGGDRVLYPFCDGGFTAVVGFADIVPGIKPESHAIFDNDINFLLNDPASIFNGYGYTGLKFSAHIPFEEVVDPVEDTSLTTGITFEDVYKAVPVLIDNDGYCEYPGGSPTQDIIDFDPADPNILGNMLLNDAGVTNEASFAVVGQEPAECQIAIPGSRVFAGDGLDVVPPELKGDALDTNFVFYGRRTFEEGPVDLIIEDYFYQFVLNDPRLGLNDDRFVLNDAYSRRLLSTTAVTI